MAAPLPHPLLASFVDFIATSHQDGNGGYIRPYHAMVTQAEGEFHQLTDIFRARLYTLLEDSVSMREGLRASANALRVEYHAARCLWNSLTPALQTSERYHIGQCFGKYVQDSHDLESYWADVITECRTVNASEFQRVRRDFTLPFDMSLLINSIERQRQDINQSRVTLQNKENTYRNPFQLAPQGTKILGKHSVPKALTNQWWRQILPPASILSNLGWLNSAQALPHDDPSLTWQGEPLGAGGMGSATLYSQRDAHGTVTDRLVIKDSYGITSEAAFRMPNYWHGDSSAANWQQVCVPLEYHTQRLASDDGANRHVARVVGLPLVHWPSFTVRLLMEYSPDGDISRLISRHQDHDEPIPEKFIWLTFQALANACMVMKQGSLDQQRNPWSEIVHCDFKPDNVFLGRADPDYYPQWPTPQLGDFGLAFATSNNDATNPTLWSLAGTQGYLAPEQRQYVDSVTGQPVGNTKLLSSCNVYGIGTVLFAMMEQRMLNFNEQPSFLPGVPPNQYRLDPLIRALYSNDLCIWVEGCLAVNPDHRPTIEQLKQFTAQQLTSAGWAFDRAGIIGPQDDTLLWPNYPAKLRWASRMHDGPEGVDDVRVPRSPNEDGSTVVESN